MTIQQRIHDRVVLPTFESAVNVFKKRSKGETSDGLQVFGYGSYDYKGLITTKNSPLGVVLQHASNIMFERGAFSYLKRKWLSNLEDSCSKSTFSDKTVVRMIHVYLAFVYYSSLLLMCIVLLAVEIFSSKFSQLSQLLV